MFDELEKVVLASDLSPAFEVTIESMIDGALTAEELEEIQDFNPFEPVHVLRDDSKIDQSGSFTIERRDDMDKNGLLYPDRTLWSLFMFACYFDCKDAALHWLEDSEFVAAPVATVRPPYSNQEHHVMTGVSAPDFD